MSQLVNKYKK